MYLKMSLYLGYMENSQSSTVKMKTNRSVVKWTNSKDVMANEHVKKIFTITKEVKIKITMRFYYTPILISV